MRFEWYVLNGNFNKKTVEMFNVFDNIKVQEYTEKAIRKYLRAPSKFSYTRYHSVREPEEVYYGFEALVHEIDSIIKWEEWSRCEYEIGAYELFYPENAQKLDCYYQCKPNMVSIAHECLRQYKEQKKEEKNGTDTRPRQ